MSNTRKPIADLIEELRSWLPNYDHGPDDYPTIFYRILANAPGADELIDIGYEPIGNMGWHELDLLGRVLVAIQDKRDVEDLVAGLVHEEGEEVEEARSPRPARPARPAPHVTRPQPMTRPAGARRRHLMPPRKR